MANKLDRAVSHGLPQSGGRGADRRFGRGRFVEAKPEDAEPKYVTEKQLRSVGVKVPALERGQVGVARRVEQQGAASTSPLPETPATKGVKGFVRDLYTDELKPRE